MTLDCVNSLYSYPPENNIEVLLISNNSSKEELQKVVHGVDRYSNTKVLEYNNPFNFQKINNWGAEQATGRILLFLNNDTELVKQSRGLLDDMIKKAIEEEVGAVGCLLLYGDARHVQHAGVRLVSGGGAEHLYIHRTLDDVKEGVAYPLVKDRRVTAVTAAALMVEKSKFKKVGGFDEEFIVCGGDVDLCIRLNDKGYGAWYVSGGCKYILHKESTTRSGSKIPYIDYLKSYESYINAYDFKTGDKFLPFKHERGSINV